MRAKAPEDWEAVLTAVQAGDRVALVKLTNLVTGFLARYRAFEVRESWDDLIQEVLVALVRSAQRGALRDGRAFVSYVGSITRNKLADHRDRMRRPGGPDLEGDPETAHALAELGEGRHTDVYVELQRGLDRLSEKLRQVVGAVYMRGLSYEEAARELGIPLGTLKRLQVRALRELRGSMGVET